MNKQNSIYSNPCKNTKSTVKVKFKMLKYLIIKFQNVNVYLTLHLSKPFFQYQEYNGASFEIKLAPS